MGRGMSQVEAGEGPGFGELVVQLRGFMADSLGGDPSDRALARATKVSPTTIGQWLKGTPVPPR